MKINKYVISITLLLVALFGLGCSSQNSDSDKYIGVGALATHLMDAKVARAAEFRAIPFRLLSAATKSEGNIDQNIDVVDLLLAAQSGRAYNKNAVMGITHCYAPSVRNGWPSVQCEVDGGGEVILAGNDTIRSKLLHIRKGEQIAYVVGKVRDIYANTLVLYVV